MCTALRTSLRQVPFQNNPELVMLPKPFTMHPQSSIMLRRRAHLKGTTMTTARTLNLSVCLVIGLLALTPDRPAAQSGSHLLDVVELLANGETVFGSFANIASGAAGAIDMSRSHGH